MNNLALPGMRQAVKAVNATFEYKSDGWIDRWSFKTPGDCENYALLVLKEYFGSEKEARAALWDRRAFIWYVTTDNGNGHAILELNGWFVCNRTKRWHSNIETMGIKKSHYRYPRFVMALKMGVG